MENKNWKPKWLIRFNERHPRLSLNIWQFIKYGLIGWALTILQYIGFTFLPYAFGIELAGVEWFFPKIPLPYGNGKYYWSIIGFDVLYDASGNVKIGGGLGYTISWVISYFIAQLINFPLQRKITYKSHGKILYQFLWYLLSLFVVTLTSNAVNSLWIKPASEVLPDFVYQILQTLATSGFTTITFFFTFKIIFKDSDKVKEEKKKWQEFKDKIKD